MAAAWDQPLVWCMVKYVSIHTHTHTHTHTHVCVYIYIYTCKCVCVYTYIRIYVRTYLQTYSAIYTHTHTHTHTYRAFSMSSITLQIIYICNIQHQSVNFWAALKTFRLIIISLISVRNTFLSTAPWTFSAMNYLEKLVCSMSNLPHLWFWVPHLG